MVLLYKYSATNLKFRPLYDTQGLSCSIYKASTNMSTHSVDTWCNKLTYSMAPYTMPLNIEGQGQLLGIDCSTLKYILFNLRGNHVS